MIRLTLADMMKAKLNKWVLMVVLVATGCDCKATVLYVRYTSQEIVIGADSKRTSETGETSCVCKIAHVGDTFIASAGLVEYGSFDPDQFAREAINGAQSLVDARARFEELIEQPLIGVLKRLRDKDQAEYEGFKRGAVLNMVFVRFRQAPELAASALTPKDGPNGSIMLEKNPITFIGNVKRPKRISVGVSKRAQLLLDQPALWSNGTVAGVQRVVQLSIEDNGEAGGPIDVVQLTKGTARWFPREPQCDSKSRRINDQPSSCNSGSH